LTCRVTTATSHKEFFSGNQDRDISPTNKTMCFIAQTLWNRVGQRCVGQALGNS